MVTCSAYGCKNTTTNSKSKGIKFYKFPTDPVRREQWTKAIKILNFTPSTNAKICSIHFKEEDFDKSSLSIIRIKEHAVPSIFPAFPSYLQRKAVVRRSPMKRKISPQQTTPKISTPQTPPQIEKSVTPIPSIFTPETSWVVLDIETPMDVDTPQIRKMGRKIIRQNRLIKCLQQRSWRMKKKVEKLENLIKTLKVKFKLAEKSCTLLTGISDTSRFLVSRQIKKAQGKKLQNTYDEKLRNFALTLHYISPRAYEYVRQQFDTCLPHSKTLAAWYKTGNAEPGHQVTGPDHEYVRQPFATCLLHSKTLAAWNKTVNAEPGHQVTGLDPGPVGSGSEKIMEIVNAELGRQVTRPDPGTVGPGSDKIMENVNAEPGHQVTGPDPGPVGPESEKIMEIVNAELGNQVTRPDPGTVVPGSDKIMENVNAEPGHQVTGPNPGPVGPGSEKIMEK